MHGAPGPGPEGREDPAVMLQQLPGLELRAPDAHGQRAVAHAVEHAQAAPLADLADFLVGLASSPLPGPAGPSWRTTCTGHPLAIAASMCWSPLSAAAMTNSWLRPIEITEHAAVGRLDQRRAANGSARRSTCLPGGRCVPSRPRTVRAERGCGRRRRGDRVEPQLGHGLPQLMQALDLRVHLGHVLNVLSRRSSAPDGCAGHGMSSRTR